MNLITTTRVEFELFSLTPPESDRVPSTSGDGITAPRDRDRECYQSFPDSEVFVCKKNEVSTRKDLICNLYLQGFISDYWLLAFLFFCRYLLWSLSCVKKLIIINKCSMSLCDFYSHCILPWLPSLLKPIIEFITAIFDVVIVII